MLLAVVILSLALESQAQFLQAKPDWLRFCRRSDPELNECMRDGLQTMFPALSRGIPEVEVERFEPLFLKEIGIERGQGGLSIAGALEDLKVHGPSNSSVTFVKMDLKNNHVDFGLAAPYLRLESKYRIKGKILLLPVVGTGESIIHLKDCKCKVSMDIDMKNVEGREIIQVPRMTVDLSVGAMRLHLDNLFNGNKVLGQTVNQFLNKNSLQVIDELKEDIGKALSEVFTGILNNAFKHLPTDLWLPNE